METLPKSRPPVTLETLYDITSYQERRMNELFETMGSRFEQMDKRFKQVNGRLDCLQADMATVKDFLFNGGLRTVIAETIQQDREKQRSG